MSKLDYKELYRRNLPHIQPPGATLFVTFRLAGSLPRHVLEALYRQSEERLTVKLASPITPERHKQTLYNEQKRLFADIDQFLNTTQTGPHWLKETAVAQMVNDILQRRGAFWQHESYDHFVRDEAELRRIRRYILQNPVQAGLVEHWEDWPWSFTRYPL